MINLSTILAALPAIGPTMAALPAIKELIEGAIGLLSNEDQQTAKEAYVDLMEDNDAGYARLNAKLETAKQRGL